MQPEILLIDDNPGMIQLMGHNLNGLARLRFATSGEAGLRLLRERTADLILLDAEMPAMSGFEVCRALKLDPALCDIPVIFVTAHAGTAFELECFQAGAVDFIAKPISAPVLLARVRTQLRVKKLSDELRRLATLDPLTEVANRRGFDDAFEREWKTALRLHQPISLLSVDVDHFKLFNDRYGHPGGDVCLQRLSQAFRSACLRPGDLVARCGGEEFALLLPHTPRGGAQEVAGRVLAAVAALALPHEASPTARHVTVSVGIGSFEPSSPGLPAAGHRPAEPSSKDLVECADKALYAAKRGGRAQAWTLELTTDGPGEPVPAQRAPGEPAPVERLAS